MTQILFKTAVSIRNYDSTLCFYGNRSLAYRVTSHYSHKGAHLLQHVSAEECFWTWLEKLNAAEVLEVKKTTDPAFAPDTAWLRKASGEVCLHIPFEKPVTEGLNSLKISDEHKTRREIELTIRNLLNTCIILCLFTFMH